MSESILCSHCLQTVNERRRNFPKSHRCPHDVWCEGGPYSTRTRACSECAKARATERPICRNRHCDAPSELDHFGQCQNCGGYHREFDTALYSPQRDERARLAEEERREQIRMLRGGLRGIVVETVEQKRWIGCEFGKAVVGNSFLGALKELGCDPKEELAMACEGMSGR